ncbi:hypothetical protein B4135_2562 [Caldibacillus debilis]|uniref:Uncharacterized protein n=1 Tax=Caldibacillus debilis TaxID=301148 RepID=A0A150LYH5_9BACI|nr:hypothetical protein B4135_2562 [Caldibacillus debilis]
MRDLSFQVSYFNYRPSGSRVESAKPAEGTRAVQRFDRPGVLSSFSPEKVPARAAAFLSD